MIAFVILVNMSNTRINKLSIGYVAATSNNLPSVDFEMLMNFIENSINSRLETQGWKMQKSGREGYGDSAIGYVQVKRTNKVVEVIAKMTPEHKLHTTPYNVTAQVDECKGCLNVKCHDCVASQGVCKHAIAFAMWLHRRTEEPLPTSTICYWKRSFLSTVKDQGTYLKVSQMKPKELVNVKDDLSEKVLCGFLKEQPVDCQLLLHLSDVETKKGSIHSLICKFYQTSAVKSAQNFLKYAERNLPTVLLDEIECNTKEQSQSSYWYELRYARVTASKLHEVCNCKTPDGSLVAAILGASKFQGNWATQRGLKLENDVISQLEVETGQKYNKSGFIINEKYPFFGASPDAISGTHVVEIKCPWKDSTISKYISTDGSVNRKFYAQLQAQMFLSQRKKGFFCVADPGFESNHKITFHEFSLDETFCKNSLKIAKAFWMKNIFHKLKRK